MAKVTLKAARINAGYKQKEAAKLLGVGNGTLGSWENGKTFPDAEKIERICGLYAIPYDDIVFLPKSSLNANFAQAKD